MTTASMRWSESKIGRSLAKTVFHKHLVVLPNACWPGFESDLLVVTSDLYLIDVEIKISRQDLKSDAGKKKWVTDWHQALCSDGSAAAPDLARLAKWPARVWKHYYALPKLIWDKGLIDALPSKESGVLLLTENPPRVGFGAEDRSSSDLPVIVDVARHAAPNTAVGKLSHEDVIDISRLASLRMWDAFAQADAEVEVI